jgi:hydrogenase nickel incorporation protein HypA/HybF
MHEFGLCEGVLDAVRQRAGGRRVTGVRVRFGIRHAVDEESLAQAFAMMADGTEAAGAAVELVTVPATIVCPDCGFRGETTDLLATCPTCASPDAQVSGGDEMTLESITYAAPPVTADQGSTRNQDRAPGV